MADVSYKDEFNKCAPPGGPEYNVTEPGSYALGHPCYDQAAGEVSVNPDREGLNHLFDQAHQGDKLINSEREPEKNGIDENGYTNKAQDEVGALFDYVIKNDM